MAQQFEDIVIVDLDVQKTTWSRVHSAMRTLYLKLSRDPDIAWSKFFFEERNSRVELKRHGLWIEDGYIVFDCLLIDVDSHHLPDIRQSIAYANERSRALLHAQQEEREQLKVKAREEAEMLKSLRSTIRDDARSESPAPESSAAFETEAAHEPATAHSLEEAAHAQLEAAADQEPPAQMPADAPVTDYERRLREFYEAMAPKIGSKQLQPEAAEPEPVAVEATTPAPEAPELAPPEAESLPTLEEDVSAQFAHSPSSEAQPDAAPAPVPPPAAESTVAEPEVTETSAADFETKRNDWRARFRAAFERNKN